MSQQAARAPVSPALGTTSYGQVIEYIQSKELQPTISPIPSRYMETNVAPQTDSTWHHILILPMSALRFHIQLHLHLSSHLPSAPPNYHISRYQRHQVPKYIPLFTSQWTMIYSIIASMQILDHYTLDTSTASLSFSTRSWDTQVMQNEESSFGAGQTRGVGQMPLACWLVT